MELAPPKGRCPKDVKVRMSEGDIFYYGQQLGSCQPYPSLTSKDPHTYIMLNRSMNGDGDAVVTSFTCQDRECQHCQAAPFSPGDCFVAETESGGYFAAWTSVAADLPICRSPSPDPARTTTAPGGTTTGPLPGKHAKQRVAVIAGGAAGGLCVLGSVGYLMYRRFRRGAVADVSYEALLE